MFPQQRLHPLLLLSYITIKTFPRQQGNVRGVVFYSVHVVSQKNMVVVLAGSLMLDCWLEVSLHPEGPSTGQLDQGFP
jgi:hypothetical protein